MSENSPECTFRANGDELVVSDPIGSSVCVRVAGHHMNVTHATGSRVIACGHTPVTFRGRYVAHHDNTVTAADIQEVRYVFNGPEACADEVVADATATVAGLLEQALESNMLDVPRVPRNAAAEIDELLAAEAALERDAHEAHAEWVRLKELQDANDERLRSLTDQIGVVRKRLFVLQDPNFGYEVLWPNKRSAVAHLYVPGPGFGDGSLCGVALAADCSPQRFANDDICPRCHSIARQSPNLPHAPRVSA